jgi:hypothetical protein
MISPDMNNETPSGFILRENSNDKTMLDICTKNMRNGKIMVWGTIHSDFLGEVTFKNVDTMAWEGLPANDDDLTGIAVTLNLADYEIEQK